MIELEIKSVKDKQDLISRVDKYDLENGPLSVKIDKLKSKRSVDQNALFHVWTEILSQEMKNIGRGYCLSAPQWKEFLKRNILGYDVVDTPAGLMEVIHNTSDLKVPGMKKFMDDVHDFILHESDGMIVLKSIKEGDSV